MLIVMLKSICRELLYELYKYVNDMRSNLALVNSYIKWHGEKDKMI